MYIIVVGCGRVGSELAHRLADDGHNVVVVDKKSDAFKNLGTEFNGVTVVGDGFDVDLLKEAGAETADAFCTVTDHDNANIMSGQVAKKIFHIPKVITRINDPHNAHVYKELGIEIVSSTSLLAATIRNKIIEGKFSSFLLEDSRLDTMEIKVEGKVASKTVEQINMPGELLVSAIIRDKAEVFIPRPKDKLLKGDILIAVVKTESLPKIKKTLGLNKPL